MTSYGDTLWHPSAERLSSSHMGRFRAQLAARRGVDLGGYEALHRFSLENPGIFWQEVAAFTQVRWQREASLPYDPPPAGRLRGARWFAESRLNYAENLLERADHPEVIVAHAEGTPRCALSLSEVRSAVARCAASLRAAGVGPGDRVAGVLSNRPEAIIAMLATASLGGIWSSCSPDFGVSAITDRLGQVAPKVVFFTTAYRYGNKAIDCRATIREALGRLPMVRQAVLVSHLPDDSAPSPEVPTGTAVAPWPEFLAAAGEVVGPPLYEAMPFDAPLFILFSSGTTGVPKCITHGVGGTLLQHKKELLLHSDVGPFSRLFYYTTAGWMMWNWMVSALATGASLVLYDGGVAEPDAGVLWRLVRDEGVTHFGTSPKYLSFCMAQNLQPKAILAEGAAGKGGGAALRTILATGSPLLPEHGAWVYREVGEDLHLASISGGTDIISCFMLGTPLLPVRAGEIQYAGLGMAVEAWDEAGRPVRGTKGELVCTQAFPSMPVGFWNDPDGRKYHQAYFAHYESLGREVWRHGDFIEITPAGGVIVFGRSDATLNPGGVRIGTAELYREVEALPEILDAIAIGQKDGDDTKVVLFVKLRPGLVLDAGLLAKIKGTIRANLTPRHVPKDVFAVADIPYTRSGKKVELAVTQAVHGEPVTNLSALANPEAMEAFFAMGRKS